MIAEELADWAVSTEVFPDAVSHAARRHLLDGFGTALGALRLDAVGPALRVSRGLGGPLEATIIGDSTKVGAASAALANGALVHGLDFDDTHAGGLVHATSVVLPAAFAVGEETGATGREVLDAVIVGLETVCRVGAAASYAFQARGLHATMVGGVFSAAIVSARLMGLTADETTSALGIAGSQAGGLLAFLSTGASTKQLHPGMASHAGVIAARLAAAGASGPANVFEGPFGLYDALVGGEGDPASIVTGLGQRWETTRIGIKPYPACQLSHAAIDAVRAALRTQPFGPDDIVEIRVTMHPDAADVVCAPGRDLALPTTTYGAKFSMPWCLAALVIDGDLTLESFTDASIARAEVADLARRITWDIDSIAIVAADAPGHVDVRLRDGASVVGDVERSSGGPDAPLTREQLVAKFMSSAGSGDDVVDLIEHLDDVGSVIPILAACAAVCNDPPHASTASPDHAGDPR